MAEYIDREALKTCQDCIHKKVCHARLSASSIDHADVICDSFKSAAGVVEVVRCEECKHKGWVQEPCHGKSIDYCRFHEFAIHGCDFCSYGERKEGTE